MHPAHCPPLHRRSAIVALGLILSVAVSLAADTPPQPVAMPPPVYPTPMRTMGVQGTVEINFVVDPEGTVRDPQIHRSTNPWFERPALDAILRWKFKPGIKDGKAVNTRMRQQLKFTLTGGATPLVIRKSSNHDSLPPELRWHTPPQVTNSCFPVYPFEALRAKQQATFLLSIIVDPKGHVTQAKIVGDAPESMAGAARAIAPMWEFKPAKDAAGAPCHALVAFELNFKADGTGTSIVSDSARDILRELGRPQPRIVDAADLDTPPNELTNRRIAFPLSQRATGAEGSAEVEFYIDREGDAQLPRVISATHEDFGHSALLAAACWRFEPVRKDGKVVIARVRRTVNFRLTD